MNQLFPVARVIVAACLLAATPRAIDAQTNDSLQAAARATDNEASLRLAQREIAEAQREVLQAQREVQREVASVQREAMAAQREAQEVVRAQSMAIREATREATRSQLLAQREVVMAQRQAIMVQREARLEETRKMIDQMVRDRLIDRTNDIHIEFRDEHLYINGKEQPKAVYDKYKPFFHQNNEDLRLNLGQGIAI